MAVSSRVRRLSAALHGVDHAVGRLRGTRRVLAELRTPVSHAILNPVCTALLEQSDVELWFSSESPEAVAPLVEPAPLLTHHQVEWRRFDLYLNSDPWAAARLRRCARRVNFFHGVAGKYDLDEPRHLPMGFEYYDRVAFINRDRMQRYLAAGIVTADQARLVGYPKLDRLGSGCMDGSEVRAALRLDSRRPTVLYAPTYSPASSLHLAGEAIVNSLAAHGFNVIVKLHDRSLDPDPRYTGGIDWRTRMQSLERPGQVRYVESADITAWLSAADVMVTDHSSAGFEYLVLDRPLLVFHAPDLAAAARINEDKVRLLRSAATVVQTPLDLVAAAGEELRRPERLSPERRRVVTEVFHKPGTATDRAVDLVRELLAMPAHSRVPQRPIEQSPASERCP